MPTQVSLLDGALASAGTLAIQTNGTTNAITISSAQVATFVNNPIMTGLTASRAVFTDGSKGLTSNAITGTGNVVMSASPTLTGTIDGAALTLSSSLTLSGGTANGVLYLNGSKVATSGSALTFDGTNLGVGTASPASAFRATIEGANQLRLRNSTTRYRADLAVNSSGLLINAYDDTGGVYLDAALDGSQLIFRTSATEQMRLTSTGLGIGTSSPGYKLDVDKGSAGLVARFKGGTRSAYIYSDNDAVYFTSDTSVATAFGVNETSDILTFFTNNAERARIDSSGNLGLGVTPSAGYRASIKGNYSSIVGGIEFDNGGGDKTVLGFASATSPSFIISNQSASGVLRFDTNNTERARIDSSGVFLVGDTSAITNVVGIQATTATSARWPIACKSVNRGLLVRQTDVNGGIAAYFEVNNGTNVGAINTTATATSYATSSDYRLKENIQPMQNALGVVAQLKPVTYTWKADGSEGQGFIAHELQAVVPDCVTGEKDAVDADGKPIYQGIDTSFLVATLTAAIQELKAEFDAYKATHP